MNSGRLEINRAIRSAGESWLDRSNPLSGLTIREAQGIYDSARSHGSALLQRVYAEIEAADPVLQTCVERRAAALAGMGWRVKALAGTDDALAAEQRAAASEFANGIDNLDEAVEHLDLAFFRGFSHAQPVWELGTVRRVELLESWNFLFDSGVWYWNPDCAIDASSLDPVPEAARLVSLVRRRAIDYPATAIYMRHALAERDWGRFLERYGIPPVDAVMGPDATSEQRADYLSAAEKARDGAAAVWPSGTSVSRAEGSRGQDPFSAFIAHQEKLVVLMATGGTLTSLAESGSGTLAGGAQMDVWLQIVRRDSQLIGAALDRALFRPYLESRFPGRPVCAAFELGKDAEPDPADLFELAAKARQAGYLVDRAELSEKSGYTLENDTSGASSSAEPPLQSRSFPLQNAARGFDGKTPAPDAAARPGANGGVSRRALESMAADISPAGKAVADLLALPDADMPAAAAALAERLPEMLPGDPAMAASLEEALAEAFSGGLQEGGIRNRQSEKCPRCGRWLDANGVCRECVGSAASAESGENPDSLETQSAEIGKSKSAIGRCLATKTDVYDAVSRGDIGLISFVYGEPVDSPSGKAHGLSHILDKHGEGAIDSLGTALIRGQVINPAASGNKIEIDYNGFRIHLAKTKSRPGAPSDHATWILTAFKMERADDA